MKTGLFTTAALSLMLSVLGTTNAFAGKLDEIIAPISVTNSNSANSTELTSLWTDGKQQEIIGLDQINDGEKLIKKAQKEERKATEKLGKVQALSDEQRAGYKRLVSSFGVALTPYAVETEIKTLKKAADEWKDVYQRLEKADARVKEAQAQLAAGQSSVRTGNELVLLGREKMQRAEAQSKPDYVAPSNNRSVDDSAE